MTVRDRHGVHLRPSPTLPPPNPKGGFHERRTPLVRSDATHFAGRKPFRGWRHGATIPVALLLHRIGAVEVHQDGRLLDDDAQPVIRKRTNHRQKFTHQPLMLARFFLFVRDAEQFVRRDIERPADLHQRRKVGFARVRDIMGVPTLTQADTSSDFRVRHAQEPRPFAQSVAKSLHRNKMD